MKRWNFCGKQTLNRNSSTKHINSKLLKEGNCNNIWLRPKLLGPSIWSTVTNNVHGSRRAQFKCKSLAGIFILQVNMAAFHNYAVNPTCNDKLCSKYSETFHGNLCFIT